MVNTHKVQAGKESCLKLATSQLWSEIWREGSDIYGPKNQPFSTTCILSSSQPCLGTSQREYNFSIFIFCFVMVRVQITSKQRSK